jgi:predicted aspartyl protease
VTLAAIVDTGFDGDFCLPTAHEVQLGLELIGERLVELADGTR